jgi:hypothetical protein
VSCVLLAALACAEGDSRPRLLGSGDNTESCRAACDAIERCTGDAAAGCFEGCQNSRRGYFRRVSEQALHEEALCLRDKACPADLEELFISCFVQAGQAVEITSKAADFCEGMAETFFVCAWFSAPSQCAREHARYTDPALSAGALCAGTPCEELESCVDATLWTFGD